MRNLTSRMPIAACSLTATAILAATLFAQESKKPATAKAGGEPEWKVGLAQIKITPERPVLMSGYAGRTRPFEEVALDLYAKALVLEDRQGHRAVVVTSDLLGFPAAVAEPICERLRKKAGLKR